jgi:hypothetical protein
MVSSCGSTLRRRESVDALRERILAEYPARTGLAPRVFDVEAVAGAGYAP